MLQSKWGNLSCCSTNLIHVCKTIQFALDCRQSYKWGIRTKEMDSWYLLDTDFIVGNNLKNEILKKRNEKRSEWIKINSWWMIN